jgi:hypothetical protein
MWSDVAQQMTFVRRGRIGQRALGLSHPVLFVLKRHSRTAFVILLSTGNEGEAAFDFEKLLRDANEGGFP